MAVGIAFSLSFDWYAAPGGGAFQQVRGGEGIFRPVQSGASFTAIAVEMLLILTVTADDSLATRSLRCVAIVPVQVVFALMCPTQMIDHSESGAGWH